MQFFRDISFDVKYLIEDFLLLCEHPTRKETVRDMGYHWAKLWDTLIFHPWYCLKRGIRNLIIWFPTIWENDCWDYFQLCNLMDKQLKEMETFWEGKSKEEREGYSWEADKGWRCQYCRVWKRIRWTRKLMDMWRDEHYNMKAYDENKALFPRDSNRLLDYDDSKTTYDKYGIPILYECKPMADDEREDYHMRAEIARKMEAKTFKLWQKNLGFIQHWWHVFIFVVSASLLYSPISNIV